MIGKNGDNAELTQKKLDALTNGLYTSQLHDQQQGQNTDPSDKEAPETEEAPRPETLTLLHTLAYNGVALPESSLSVLLDNFDKVPFLRFLDEDTVDTYLSNASPDVAYAFAKKLFLQDKEHPGSYTSGNDPCHTFVRRAKNSGHMHEAIDVLVAHEYFSLALNFAEQDSMHAEADMIYERFKESLNDPSKSWMWENLTEYAEARGDWETVAKAHLLRKNYGAARQVAKEHDERDLANEINTAWETQCHWLHERIEDYAKGYGDVSKSELDEMIRSLYVSWEEAAYAPEHREIALITYRKQMASGNFETAAKTAFDSDVLGPRYQMRAFAKGVELSEPLTEISPEQQRKRKKLLKTAIQSAEKQGLNEYVPQFVDLLIEAERLSHPLTAAETAKKHNRLQEAIDIHMSYGTYGEAAQIFSRHPELINNNHPENVHDALRCFELTGQYDHALSVAETILDKNRISYYQKLCELTG